MIDREKLIERESEKYRSDKNDELSDRDSHFMACGFIDGINSDLNKKLTELAVVDGKIELIRKLSLQILDKLLYDELITLESQREELIKQLNEPK